MHRPITPSKLWYALGLVVILLLSGCPSPPVTKPSPSEPVSQIPDTATYHIVKRGETLYGIAQRYGRNHKDVGRWNNIPPPYELTVGQRLRIDGPSEDSVTTPVDPQDSGFPVVTPTPQEPTPIIPPIEPPKNVEGTHIVQPGETLYGIAINYGKDFRELAAWNGIEQPFHVNAGQTLKLSPPIGWDPTLTPPARPIRKPTVSEPIAPTQPIPSPQVDKDHYIVQPGDSLYRIARRYGLSIDKLALWNALQPPYSLSVGKKLRITRPSVLPTPPNVGRVLPTRPSPSTSPSSDTFDDIDGDSDHHIVAPGDTLWQIARHYRRSVKELREWNNLASDNLSVGQQLRVTPPATRTMPRPAPDRPRRPVVQRSYHIVKPGETLNSIADKYGISFSDLAEWNGIGSPYTVYPGLKLKLYQ
jgi:peptidoglycan endopeptidase LytF